MSPLTKLTHACVSDDLRDLECELTRSLGQSGEFQPVPNMIYKRAKELRVGPGRQRQPVAGLWKFWVEGNEIYATTRALGQVAKISVHASGQIHMRIESRELQQLAPPMPLGNGNWLHAFELRFLVGVGSQKPPQEKLKGTSASLINLPDDAVLILNLLVGQEGSTSSTPMPHEFSPSGEVVWMTQLRDTRPVILVGRVHAMDEVNRTAMDEIRLKLRPQVNLTKRPTRPPYLEIRQISWDPKGGNVVLVVPLGPEAFRVDADSLTPVSEIVSPDTRVVAVSSGAGSADIVAPDGMIVATLVFSGISHEVSIIKGSALTVSLGTVTLRIDTSTLKFGQKFGPAKVLFPAPPIIAGGTPKNWTYQIYCTFDGTTLQADIRTTSSALRNSNMSAPMANISNEEEIVVVSPRPPPTLRASREAPSKQSELQAVLLIREI